MFQLFRKGAQWGHALMPKDLLLARKDDDGNTQTLYDHLHNTSKLAAGFEKRSSVTAFAAGLLHDSGKATDDFKRYLLTGNRKRGSRSCQARRVHC